MVELGDLGGRLRRERERAGLSLAGLAQETGLSKSYLLRLETQPSNPSLAVLDRVASALGITVADLLGAPAVPDPAASADVPEALRVLADQDGLTSADLRTLASIRFRKGEEPRTV